jgi:acetoin utilization deacetylase AcuC-like enzyme
VQKTSLFCGGCAVPTALISHSACALHNVGALHPECPERLAAISDRLIAAGLDSLLVHHQAPEASREQLTRVHHGHYVDQVVARAPRQGLIHLDPDTAMMPETLRAALRAAGAAVHAVDLVMAGQARNAFCAVRPPGHHALPDRAMGFCIFNNIAVAAAHALDYHGLERVAIVDFDVHHGNGTEGIFCNDARVLLCQTFQHPFYPYQGADSGSPRRINVPLSSGTGSDGFRAAIEQHWLPALEAFGPQMLFISAGFDAHREDPMAYLELNDADFAWVTRQLLVVADQHAQGRIVSTLEGGYALDALGRAAAEHVRALIEG